MPKRGRKFITEFLVPNLNEETFGARLAWVDYASSIFQIQWNHKAASAWKEEDCQVFMEWDKKRGHYRPEEKEYFTKSKQRFRAVLNKSIQDNEITQLHSEDKTIKIYFLGPPEAAPFDLKFDILKDAVDEKNIILTNYLGVDSELIDSLHSEKDQSTKIDYSNALKDHNYQNVEEHKISVSYDDICYDAITRNDMSLYNDEPNVYASLNMMGQTIDENFLENLSLAVLDSKKECNPLLESNSLSCGYGNQVLNTVAFDDSAPDNSLEISSKRRLEHFDNPPAKKSKILFCLNDTKAAV